MPGARTLARGREHFQREVSAGRCTHECEACGRTLQHNRGRAGEVRLGDGDHERIGDVRTVEAA